MHILQASFVTNFANTAFIGFCVLGTGFMLCFLVALTKERKASQVRCRLEYRISGSLPDAATGQLRPLTARKRSQKEYDRGELFPGTPQALNEVTLTREIRFIGSSGRQPNRA